MKLNRSQVIIIGIVFVIVLIFVLGFLGIIPIFKKSVTKGPTVTLNFWGIDDEKAFNEVIASYQNEKPSVHINYRRFETDRYELDLINGLAASNGPDIFMFRNTWLPKHYDKVVPLTETQFPLRNFTNLYPTVAEQDFAPDGVIYALPLYIDTLALFYNKDIFDSKGVVFPPKTWSELEKLIPQLKETDRLGRIQKAAAALGGSYNSINHATDILSLLMLQNNVSMVDKDFTEATFAKDGVPTLSYYTQFANPAAPLYAWDEKFGFSLDTFSEEKTAIIFDYSDAVNFLKEKSPFLNFEVLAMPQKEGAPKEINYANYWGLSASNKSKNSGWAWDFIAYLAANKDVSKKYLDAVKRPPALRLLIQDYLNDPVFGVFARQSLTARSWPQIDNNEVEKSFSKMIESVLSGQSAESAINQAEEKITQLIKRRL